MEDIEEQPLLGTETDDRREFIPEDGPIDMWVSYSTENKKKVKSIVKNLRTKYDIKCWDLDNIPPGKPSWTVIGNVTERAKKILLVYSKEYVKSIACQHEKDMAFSNLNEGQRLNVLVVRLDSVQTPPEVNALQCVQGEGKPSADITNDLAIAFHTEGLPNNAVAVAGENGYALKIRFPWSCGSFQGVFSVEDNLVQNFRTSSLRFTMTEDDLKMILRSLNLIPWLDEPRRFSFWFMLYFLLEGGVVGLATGCMFGGLYTLASRDTFYVFWTNSKYLVLAFFIFSFILRLGQWIHDRRKERSFFHSALRRINFRINPDSNLLIHVDDAITHLTFYYFSFKACKEEIHQNFPHVLSEAEDISENAGNGREDASGGIETVLWRYLLAYRKFKADRSVDFTEPSKHHVRGWKCLCQFVKESHA